MYTILFIILGIIAGSVITWLITKSVLNVRHQMALSNKTEEMNEIINQNSVLKANMDAQDKSLEEVKQAMLDTFKSAASNALIQNNEQFLTLAKTQLEGQVNSSKGDLDQRKAAIEEMLKPVKESIDNYRKRIEELEKGSRETFGQVTAMLSNIQTTNTSLQKETGALVNALRNPRVRGRWGEIGLKRAV